MRLVPLEDGRVVDLDQWLIQGCNNVIASQIENSIVLNFFQDDGTNLKCIARVALLLPNFAPFVRAMVSLADDLGLDWKSADPKSVLPPDVH